VIRPMSDHDDDDDNEDDHDEDDDAIDIQPFLP